MRVEVIRIGDSREIRIPKSVVDECFVGDTVELQIETGRVIITQKRVPREGWAESFRRAGSSEADELLLGGLPPNNFDLVEWDW